MKTNLSRLSNEHLARTMTHRVAGAIGVAVLLLTTGMAAAQGTSAAAPVAERPEPAHPVIQAWLHRPSDGGPRRPYRRNLRQRRHVRHPGEHPVRTARAGPDLDACTPCPGPSTLSLIA